MEIAKTAEFVWHRCEDPCAVDTDCPGTRTCDGATGRCVEGVNCIDATDCDASRACVNAVCVDGCPMRARAIKPVMLIRPYVRSRSMRRRCGLFGCSDLRCSSLHRRLPG